MSEIRLDSSIGVPDTTLVNPAIAFLSIFSCTALFANFEISVCRAEPQVGDLYIAGSNRFGQLGINKPSFVTEFQSFETNVAKVAMSDSVTQLLKNDSTLWVLGTDIAGSLGAGERDFSTLEPLHIATDVLSIHGGNTVASFFTDIDGQLLVSGSDSPGNWVWGLELNEEGVTYLTPTVIHEEVVATKGTLTLNGYLFEDGTLGLTGYGVNSINEPQLGYGLYVAELANNVVDFDLNYYGVAYVDEDGKLWGVGTLPIVYSYAPFDSPILIDEDVVQVSMNKKGVSCLLYVKYDGTLWGSGSNSDGRLGLGDLGYVSEAIKIADNVKSVHCYDATTFFIDTSNRLWGMGKNNLGQLGLGDRTNRYWPTLIANDVIDVATNQGSTVMVKSDGTAWGTGNMGLLSIGIEPHYSLFVKSTNDPIFLESEVTHFNAANNAAYFRNHAGHLKVSGEGTLNPLTVATGVDALYQSPELGTIGENTVSFDYHIDAFLQDNSSEIISQKPSPLEPTKFIAAQGTEVYILENGELWFRGDPGYVRLIGSDDAPDLSYEYPTKIANNIIDAAFGYSLHILSNDGTLKAYGWSLINAMENAGYDVSNYPDGYLIIDTEVERIWGNAGLIVYRKTDGSLWGMGSNYNISEVLGTEDIFVIEPVHIDDDVIKAAPQFESIIYQKSDGSLWMKGRDVHNFERNNDRESNYLAEPTAIYADREILDFEYDSETLLLLQPSVTKMSERNEYLLSLGETATLTLGEWEEGEDINWYQGPFGDRDSLLQSGTNQIEIQPLENSIYWVEFDSEEDTNVSHSIEVRIVENSFSDWAAYYGLYQYGDSIDTDRDSYPDKVEYGFGMNPLIFNRDSPIQITPPSKESLIGKITVQVNPTFPEEVKINKRYDSVTWTSVDIQTEAQVFVGTDGTSVQFPYAAEELPILVQLSVESN